MAPKVSDAELHFVEGPPSASINAAATHILHVNVAPHGDECRVIRWTFKWVLLERDDSPGHAEASVSKDANAAAQRFAFAPSLDLCAALIREGDDVVKVVPTDMTSTFRMIFEAAGAADMDRAANDQLPCIVAQAVASAPTWACRQLRRRGSAKATLHDTLRAIPRCLPHLVE